MKSHSRRLLGGVAIAGGMSLAALGFTGVANAAPPPPPGPGGPGPGPAPCAPFQPCPPPPGPGAPGQGLPGGPGPR